MNQLTNMVLPPTESLPELNLGSDLVASVKTYWESCRQFLSKKMDEAIPASQCLKLQTQLMDQLVLALYQLGFEESSAHGVLAGRLGLFALGGYGRCELNLYSDLDILFLYEGKDQAQLEIVAKKMLYPLWDAGLEIGYSTRTIADCKRIMDSDSRALSSILDARFLVGDSKLAKKFQKFLDDRFDTHKALGQFVRAKVPEMQERAQKHGNSVYLLAPNTKESEGGLRDWHMLRYYARIALHSPELAVWVEQGLLSSEETTQLKQALEFLWEVRNRLHRLTGRAQDQVLFELQAALAKELGYVDTQESVAAEKFMQAYYGHAATLHRLFSEVSRRLLKPSGPYAAWKRRLLKTILNHYYWACEDTLLPKSYELLAEAPLEILRGFYLAQMHQLKIDEGFKFWVGQHLQLIDENFCNNTEVAQLLREMFADILGIGKSLWQLHESRLLGAIMPEFGDILFQTQHDVYHVYTVDTHSLIAVEELSKLKAGTYDEEFPVFKKALTEVELIPALVLGVLFHDIGKGKGGSHSEKGAVIARQVMTRLHYENKVIEEVEFLVLSHLIMPQLSQRRDLEDFSMIAQFAQSMGSLERLNMLYILTWADIRAVGPEVWTPWKGDLLSELYLKTYKLIESGDFSANKAVHIKREKKQLILAQASSQEDKVRLESFLESMPPRYFLANMPQDILGHFRYCQHFPEQQVVFWHHLDPSQRTNRLYLYSFNTPKLFEQVTGVMAGNQVNILALEQFFNSRGEALLLLRVTDHRGQPLDEERRFLSIQKDLEEVLQRRIPIERYAAQRRSPLFLDKKVRVPQEPKVEIDNDVSAYYTVIDIFADDRIGLLHDIAQAMTRLGLYTEVSKISTKVDQVADVFYVKDIFGHKITDRKKLALIKQELRLALSASPEGGVG